MRQAETIILREKPPIGLDLVIIGDGRSESDGCKQQRASVVLQQLLSTLSRADGWRNRCDFPPDL